MSLLCGTAEDLEHVFFRCSRWNDIRRDALGADLLWVLGSMVPETTPGHTKVWSSLLLGGQDNRVELEKWSFDSELEPNLDEYIATGGDSDDDEDDPEADRIVISPLMRSCGSLRVAAFLSHVVRARAPIIRALRDSSGFRGVPVAAEDQSRDW